MPCRAMSLLNTHAILLQYKSVGGANSSCAHAFHPSERAEQGRTAHFMRLMLRRSDFHTGLFMLRSQSAAFGCTHTIACLSRARPGLPGASWLHHSVRTATK